MKILKSLGAAVLGVALTASIALASSLSLSIVITSPVSTSVTCPLGTYNAPLAAGANVCTITVAPAGWSGTLALSGTNASSFAINTVSGVQSLAVGATALAAGTYAVTITATP
jgi:hypothetical protein